MRSSLKRHFKTYTMVIALLGIWALFGAATDGDFLQVRNLSNLFRQMAITGILASAMTLVLVAGHVDLSVGSLVAFLGALIAISNAEWAWSPTVAVIFACSVGVVASGLQGRLVSRHKIPAFIVTLGGMLVFRGLAMWVTRGNTIALPDNWLTKVGSSYLPHVAGWVVGAVVCALVIKEAAHDGKILRGLGITALAVAFLALCTSYNGVPIPVLLMLGCMGVFHLLAERTPFGRHVFAVGGNPDAARLSGVRTEKTVLKVFALMGLLSAVAALVLTARVGSASPDAGALLELDAIAACVIGGTSLMGGRGSVFGAILGALVMESLNNGMSMANMESYWQYILKGLVLVLAVWADTATQGKR